MPPKIQPPPAGRPRGAPETSTEPDTNDIVYLTDRIVETDGEACRVSTAYVDADFARGITYTGKMYVERFSPVGFSNNRNLVFLHGDFHTGVMWRTKPDGSPGWATTFAGMGFNSFVPDLPGVGNSSYQHRGDFKHLDLEAQSQSLTISVVEQEITAPEKAPFYDGEPAWPNATLHTQWPGTGQQGDKIFDAYMSSLETLTLRKPEREALAQVAIQNLLKKIGPSVLIGHGSGCTAAWLAADACPQLVLGVVALEPAGPPCARASRRMPWGRKYTSYFSYDENVRKYGLSDIPMTFSPPVKEPTENDTKVLDVEVRQLINNDGCYMAQKPQKGILIRGLKPEQECVPQLVELKRMRHAIITSESSAHSLFDWGTVRFLRQAGVDVDHYNLPNSGINGNGHMMVMEKNSDRIANMVCEWIDENATKSNLLSPENWHSPHVLARPNAPGSASSNHSSVDGQSASGSTPGSSQNSNIGLTQNGQAVAMAQQQTGTNGVFQAGTAMADAGYQTPNRMMGFNGMMFTNNDAANMVGQGQQGANLHFAQFPEHMNPQMPLQFAQMPAFTGPQATMPFESFPSFMRSQVTQPFQSSFPAHMSPQVAQPFAQMPAFTGSQATMPLESFPDIASSQVTQPFQPFPAHTSPQVTHPFAQSPALTVPQAIQQFEPFRDHTSPQVTQPLAQLAAPTASQATQQFEPFQALTSPQIPQNYAVSDHVEVSNSVSPPQASPQATTMSFAQLSAVTGPQVTMPVQPFTAYASPQAAMSFVQPPAVTGPQVTNPVEPFTAHGNPQATLTIASLPDYTGLRIPQPVHRVRQMNGEQRNNPAQPPLKRQRTGLNSSAVASTPLQHLTQENTLQQSAPQQSAPQQSVAQQSVAQQSTPQHGNNDIEANMPTIEERLAGQETEMYPSPEHFTPHDNSFFEAAFFSRWTPKFADQYTLEHDLLNFQEDD
ncbi:hypothetical protein ACHAQJ_006099 [Trichoderma viride]